MSTFQVVDVTVVGVVVNVVLTGGVIIVPDNHLPVVIRTVRRRSMMFLVITFPFDIDFLFFSSTWISEDIISMGDVTPI